jgi:hypothetical protein
MELSDINWSNPVKWVQETHRRRADDLLTMHREQYLNILWAVHGQQTKYFDKVTKTLLDYNPPEFKLHVISNFLYPWLRRAVGLLARRPIWDTLPATMDQSDINSANVATKVLQYYWQRELMDLKFIEWLVWLLTTGNALFKVCWDPKAGKVLKLTDEERAALKNALPDARIPKELHFGDLFVEVASPFSVVWEKGVKMRDKPSYIIEAKIRPCEFVRRRWKVDPTPIVDRGTNFDLKLMDVNELTAIETNDLCLVYNAIFPHENRQYIICGDKVAYSGKNDYEYMDGCPFVHGVETFAPGSEFGVSTIRHLRSNQSQYNSINSSVINNIRLLGNPQWLTPRAGRVGEITNRPGGKILYDYPFKPEISAPAQLGTYIERALLRAKDDIGTVGSTNPVSQARGEPNLRSGKAVLALQDADNSVLGPVALMADKVLEATGRKILQTVAKNVHENRIGKIVGENREVEIFSFKGSDLIGQNYNEPNIDYFDVRIGTYSTYPLSRVGMLEQLDTLLSRGVLHPERDRGRILAAIGSGDLLTNFDPEQKDRAMYHRKCYRLMRGEQLPVYPMENHEIAIETIDIFFRPRLDELSPEIIQNIQNYRSQHEAFILRKIQMMTGQLGPQQQGG